MSLRTSSKIHAAAAPVFHPEQKAYTAYGAARQLWGCRDEEILMDGPAGTGKTRAILEKIHFVLMKYSGSRGLIFRKTRESMTETVLVTFEEKVVPSGSDILLGPKRNLRQSYKYPNGSELIIVGLDKPMKIMSAEYDIAGGFEATELTEDDVELVSTRLRNFVVPYQQMMLDCNPGNPNHWLNKRAKSDRMTRLLSRHEDNPVLFDPKTKEMTNNGAKYLSKLDRLTGARRLRLRFGQWAATEGMVYEDYDEFKHLITKFKVPPSWRKIRVIDFGYTNPFVCQWWAVDNDGRMYLYREIYFSKRLVKDHAEIINQHSKNEVYEATVADWDAEDRATLHELGIFTIPAYKSILPGIEATALRFREAGDGKPRIFFMRDALIEMDEKLHEVGKPIATQQEIDGYSYPKGVDGKPIKEEPIKLDDHGMDGMRYAVAYVDNVSGMTLQVEAAEAVVIK